MSTQTVPRRRWRHPTVRARFLSAVLALSALGLTVAGVTSFALQREDLDARIDGDLARNVEEFTKLAEDGVDPATGRSFTTVSGLLRVALQRAVPAPNEGMLALVDGEPEWTAPSTVLLRIERDPELVTTLAGLDGVSRTTIRTLGTTTAQYRYVAVPVQVPGDDASGLLVFGFDRQVEHAALAATYRTYALVAVGALLVTAVLGWLLAGRLLAPVRLLRRTAQRITDSDLSDRIPVTGDDDLSDLTRTVNAMLDRLETAFDSQRRLLDDAGHELRTPLTIIRGHLELVDPSDAADVRATRDLALDELDRMQMLVDDLVVLATADRPDFIRPAPTDVARLVDEIADKAQALSTHRWTVTDRAQVEAVLDARRVTQAVLQLAANAAKFSPPGEQVRLGARVRDGRLLLEVSDDGPGVAPEDAERIFDRFVRAHAGRGVEGSGLGLPIVAAIATAHGGTVRVEASPSGGATFVLDLPLEATVVPVAAADRDDAGRGRSSEPDPDPLRSPDVRPQEVP